MNTCCPGPHQLNARSGQQIRHEVSPTHTSMAVDIAEHVNSVLLRKPTPVVLEGRRQSLLTTPADVIFDIKLYST